MAELCALVYNAAFRTENAQPKTKFHFLGVEPPPPPPQTAEQAAHIWDQHIALQKRTRLGA